MCIGIWTLEHPDYALVLGTNRDEVLNRPTEQAHFHSFASQTAATGDARGSDSVLAGRDIQGGGSWFGINRAGRVALLTNISEPAAEHASSRGSLVSSFLLSTISHPLEHREIRQIVKEDEYAGFNLLLLAPAIDNNNNRSKKGSSSQSVCYESLFVTNHGGGGTLAARDLKPHERTCGCISNGVDAEGATLWPKVKQATTHFGALLRSLPPETSEAELIEHIFDLLSWHPERMITNRNDVQATIQVIPVPVLSDGGSAGSHHQAAYYGTRLSTVLLVRKDGEVLFIERDIWELGRDSLPFRADPPTERRFRFTIDGSKMT